MKNLLISACLMGVNCKYNGGNNKLPELDLLKEKYNLIPICPEEMGGLTTPRNPSEIKGNKVFSNLGNDVTDNFKNGAELALKIALENDCNVALLKERSPSCGSNMIYDGSFCGKVIEGMGLTAKLLKENNIEIFNEEQIKDLVDWQGLSCLIIKGVLIWNIDSSISAKFWICV